MVNGIHQWSTLESSFSAEGFRLQTISVQHLPELQEDIASLYRQDLLDKEFYQTWLTGFQFTPPDHLLNAQTIFIVAVPQPQTRISFTWQGKIVSTVMPPTYLCTDAATRQVEKMLNETLDPAGYQVAKAVLPKKLLAARSGLSRYGKNNIGYIDGLGSFYFLAAFYSDCPCPQDAWQPAEMMERCQNCSACERACPTGAIVRERFLLHAERCISYHNEKPSEVAFPAWMEPGWHNSLVGCMLCQKICPLDRDVIHWVEQGVTFNEEETSLLLQSLPLDNLPASLVKKLEQGELVRQIEVISRNLAVIL